MGENLGEICTNLAFSVVKLSRRFMSFIFLFVLIFQKKNEKRVLKIYFIRFLSIAAACYFFSDSLNSQNF